MPTYPGGIKVFTPRVNVLDIVDASDPNTIEDEVVALQRTLGVNPQVSTSPGASSVFSAVSFNYASVADRLANIEAGIVGDSHSQYMKLTGGSTITPSSATVVGLVLKAAALQTADMLQVQDSGGVKRVYVTSSYGLAVGGVLTASTGIVVTGSSSINGSLATKDLAVTALGVTSVPLTVSLLPSATGDAFRVLDGGGTTLLSIDSAGGLHVPTLFVTGNVTQTGTTTYAAAIDLTAVTSTAAATGTGLGDKVMMYSNTYGFGMQSSRLVAYVPNVGAFAIRQTAGSGQKSSGTDAIVLYPFGRAVITATGGGDALTTTGGTHSLGGNTAVAGTASSSTAPLKVTQGATPVGGTNLIEGRANDNSVQFSVTPTGVVTGSDFQVAGTSIPQKGQTLGVVVKTSGGAWPATRPTGWAAVMFIGNTDPGALQLAQDVWINA